MKEFQHSFIYCSAGIQRYERREFMFKFAVIFVHGLIFIFATLISLGGYISIAPPDPSRMPGVIFTAFAIFNILVIISIFVQLKVKKVWVFLVTVLGLMVLLYFLPYIVLYIEDILRG